MPQGLDSPISLNGGNLSGGQRQRVAIVRALLRKAPIVIFDEATSSLDSQTEKAIQLAMEKTIGDCTSLVITHRLSTIKKADKVIVLDRGKVVEQGSIKDLLELNGLFRQMWEIQKFH